MQPSPFVRAALPHEERARGSTSVGERPSFGALPRRAQAAARGALRPPVRKNAPPLAPNYWVFFAATTNVQFRVTVTDTDAVLARRYSNPQGTVALPVADTQAFATCP